MAPGFRCAVSVWVFLAVVLVVRSSAIEFVAKPGVFYPIEGEALAITCSARGQVNKVEFRRKDTMGLHFIELNDTERVYTNSKKDGNITTSILNFKTVEVSDDSSASPGRRYSCWVYGTTNTPDEKLDFHVSVTSRKNLPQAYPDSAVVLDKKLGDSLELKCNITIPSKNVDVELKSLHWKKNDEITQTVYTVDGEFKEELDVLKFNSISLDNVGNYSCIMETTLRRKREFNVTAGPFVVNIIPEFTGVKKGSEVEAKKGKAAKIKCSAVGYPLFIEWKVRQKYETTWNTIAQNLCNETRRCINSEENILQIRDVQYSDRGFYNCCVVSENSTNNDCQEFVLRVRDPLGPLWPVIGIVIEVILLVIIIYFAQKKKNNKAAVGKTDGRAEFSYSSTDDGDRSQVRLRSAGDKPKEA